MLFGPDFTILLDPSIFQIVTLTFVSHGLIYFCEACIRIVIKPNSVLWMHHLCFFALILCCINLNALDVLSFKVRQA